MQTPEIIIAEPDIMVRGWLRPPLAAMLDASVTEVSCGDELQLALDDRPLGLVLTNSQLPTQTGLQVLARARSVGNTTPFIVFTSFHDSLMRVYVSDAEGTVLSSRVVDLDTVVHIAAGLLGQTVYANAQ